MNPEKHERTSRHDERVAELILREAAIFIRDESSGESLITATRAELSKNAELVTVFVSVFPPEKSVSAVFFLNRHAGEMRAKLALHRVRPLPRVLFVFDDGEANRQRLDEISGKS